MFTGMLMLVLAAATAAPGSPGESTRIDSTVGADPDQMICRRPEPRLGSRVATRRICRTRAQWQAFEQDRQQLRRDLQNSGACRGAGACTSE